MAGGVDRSHLARLCRGFLLAREIDPRRAQAFLVSFLRDLPGAKVGAAPEEMPGLSSRGREPDSPGEPARSRGLPPDGRQAEGMGFGPLLR
jgi:hypothetical protein